MLNYQPEHRFYKIYMHEITEKWFTKKRVSSESRIKMCVWTLDQGLSVNFKTSVIIASYTIAPYVASSEISNRNHRPRTENSESVLERGIIASEIHKLEPQDMWLSDGTLNRLVVDSLLARNKTRWSCTKADETVTRHNEWPPIQYRSMRVDKSEAHRRSWNKMQR